MPLTLIKKTLNLKQNLKKYFTAEIFDNNAFYNQSKRVFHSRNTQQNEEVHLLAAPSYSHFN